MKIACVTWSYDDHQGISRCVAELSARLAARHEMHVFTTKAVIEPRPGVQVHEVPLRHRRVHVNDWDFFFRAGLALRRGGFDLVHAHFPVWFPADVYSCHGLARMALRTWRGFPPQAKCDVPTLQMLPWHAQIPLYRYAARTPRAQLTAVSRKTRRDLAEESGRSLPEIEIVPNAVDLQRFRPDVAAHWRAPTRAALGLTTRQFALLWVGNHLRFKGIRHALATLERLPAEVVLIAVGSDRPESVADLAEPIARLRAAGRLHFIPADPQIEKYFAAADALLFPSLYESFGMVVLEALAMGLPVVTARSVGFAEDALEDGVNALVVEHPWQVDAMRARVEQLRGDPALSAHLREAGLRTAQRYSWERYVDATERIYERALSQRRARGERRVAA